MNNNNNCNNEIDLINVYAKKYLYKQCGVNVCNSDWMIANSGNDSAVIAGRGVIATRNYDIGDVIFVDKPLFVSPRVITPSTAGHPICPVCYAATASSTCLGGCQWPVCSVKCSDHPDHVDECRYVQKLLPKSSTVDSKYNFNDSISVYNGITPVKSVRLYKNNEYKFFIDVLQKKSTNKPAFEVGVFLLLRIRYSTIFTIRHSRQWPMASDPPL